MSKKFLRAPEVRSITGLSKSTLYDLIARDLFPRPVALGARAVGWLSDEVDAWMEQRVRVSRGHAGVDASAK